MQILRQYFILNKITRSIFKQTDHDNDFRIQFFLVIF